MSEPTQWEIDMVAEGFCNQENSEDRCEHGIKPDNCVLCELTTLRAELEQTKKERDEALEVMLSMRQAFLLAAEIAYCEGIRMTMNHPDCLGIDYKIKHGELTRKNLEALAMMERHFGAHYEIMKVLQTLKAKGRV